MNRVLIAIVLTLICMNTVFSDVSLSGIVKKTGATTGLAGVRVSLVKQTALFDTTDTDGAFMLTDGTPIHTSQPATTSFQFTFRENVIVFSSDIPLTAGLIELFSGNGRKIQAATFSNVQTENGKYVLPDLAAGIYIIKISYAGKTFTQTFACIGKNLIMRNARLGNRGEAAFTLKTQAAAAIVDTLLVEKAGYITKKIPVTSYTMKDIAVSLDSSGGTGGACTREMLNAIGETYVKALEAGDSKLIDLAADATYLENLKASAFDAGIWKSKLQVTHHRNIIDVDSCKMFVEVIDHKSATPRIIGAQITVAGGKVTQVSALVSTVGDWLLNKASDITNAYNKSSGEDWSIIPAEKRDDRKTIQAGGDAYLDAFLDSTKVTVPWGIPCARLEGGAYTGDGPNSTCNVGVPQNLKINNRIYVIDVEMGTVDIFCKFGGSMPDSHLFRLLNGKLRYVHTISINSK